MKKEQDFRNKIKLFYKQNGRSFYWRKSGLTPFQIMLVELFLKKTRAETVEKFIPTFIKKYPSNRKLLKADKEELFTDVSILGLGNQRTRALKAISDHVHENFSGKLPNDLYKLLQIPHVGMYIASATSCFGFNRRIPILDVNSSRIISRVFSISNNRDLRNNLELQEKALELVPRKNFKEYNWGLLDLGAMICKPKPLCLICPLRMICDY